MKDNREFLEGIYKKAEVLEKEKANKSIKYKRYLKYSSVAAAIVIIIPLLLFIGENSVSKEYVEIPQMIRLFRTNDPMINFNNAEYIVIGKPEKIGKSQYVKEDNYIYTDITIDIEEVFLGDIHKDEITLRVMGGKVKKDKVFSEMEGRFKKREKSLLFLREEKGIYYLFDGDESQFLEVEQDVFLDKQGNKYNLDDIKNNINRR